MLIESGREEHETTYRRIDLKDYFGRIFGAAKTTLEGLAITLTAFVKKPVTVQYPDRTAVPVEEMMAERYRGLLEVDMAICTACLACSKPCPIACISIIVEKRESGRGMTAFSIDMAKCMYCGLCSEPCPTGAIRHTRGFEAATPNIENLVLRFVAAGDYIPPFKAKKGTLYDTPRTGQILHETVKRMQVENAAFFARKRLDKKLAAEAAKAAAAQPPAAEVETQIAAPTATDAAQDAPET